MRHHFILAEFFDAYDELTPTHVRCWLNLSDSKVSSLGNVTDIYSSLLIFNTRIWSLGKLTNVGWSLDLAGTPIISLGNLYHVSSFLNLQGTYIQSLDNLSYVGGILNIRRTNIRRIGYRLRHVGEQIICDAGEQYQMIKTESDISYGRFRVVPF